MSAWARPGERGIVALKISRETAFIQAPFIQFFAK
jgi:hypothetical protein